MEREWGLFNNMTSTTITNNIRRGKNGPSTTPAWDSFHQFGTSRFDWPCTSSSTTTPPPTVATAAAADELHELMLNHRGESVYVGSHYHPGPHLTCLKLGKRQYFGDGAAAAVSPPRLHVEEEIPFGKRGKGIYCERVGDIEGKPGVTVASAVPRCQVEGCHVVLVNAKEYHRRHKVCEMHSKAPKVVVLGSEQRFCQQCSRSDCSFLSLSLSLSL